ncbi:MAG: hypothetical protein A3J07_04530 [Candidatus Doudnabacteria bacterium RIFCSPLOWO2_02_FULL_49_13]|uniref:Uncharacterized protein n=1 Tax=Candidatus Doudnabacteria bacterium RIFCSPHIGHO2_12_FULL_48_16 TaxID=1817838 RepID=A0A1F5PJQ6_9BACT|nr:MAG: hypothetical protein A3B77_04385 [Candidatus Doudnabacteria bacterium RIFCSPHIGHO2_02_FULL_49_24]OGE90173.1 MAG: hypothetical protein A3E29_03665 [Candidatus Doudnabacteria bacterium RIFCSPHIGHO2_12_FULL_48_16]OGE97816.1 MAG: hypothetical protein A2990_04190 [Candidatus Doudnabacteria bacterium RIFCSPLOWO2_01_FULL_49_40]OGF03317.1 MAG: hypothetical protein A3J07_04530 [Candidatus Doudnabacteria bacterium RIFCSPLOWO2_02_FULL_49_13]OGF03473.1 MAG: hypothetical protein A3H14_04345 [Candida
MGHLFEEVVILLVDQAALLDLGQPDQVGRLPVDGQPDFDLVQQLLAPRPETVGRERQIAPGCHIYSPHTKKEPTIAATM